MICISFFALGYNWGETDLILNIAINIVKYYSILTNLQKNGTKYMYSNERCLIFDESGNLGADGRYFVIWNIGQKELKYSFRTELTLAFLHIIW